MEIDEDNTLKLEYHNNLFIDDVMHNFTDYHINSYDNKIYYGDPTEKFVNHKGTSKYDMNKINRLRCNYCYEKFGSHTDLIRHLGYNDVDIRNRKNNLLITHFFQPIKNKCTFSPELKYSSEIAKETDYEYSDDEGILADTEDSLYENNKRNTNNIKEYVNKKKYRQLDDLFLESFSKISLNKCKICNKKNSLRCISNYSKTDMKSKLSRPLKNNKNNKNDKNNKNNKNNKINLSIDDLTKYLEDSKI